MSEDRSIIFERLLDDLELYFTYKTDLNKRVRGDWDGGNFDTGDKYWQERDTLEAIRERARRALDEYVASAPAAESEPRESSKQGDGLPLPDST